MRTKIERLDKENVQLQQIAERQANEIQKLKNELERLKKKRKKLAENNNLELVAQQLESAQNSSDKWHREYFNQYEKNRRLENEIQKLKNEKDKMTRSKVVRENKELKKEYQELFEAYKKDLERAEEEYKKNGTDRLKKHNERGAGRKARFSAEQIESIKMYRLQGKKIKEIAEIFKCSVGLVHKIINEK